MHASRSQGRPAPQFARALCQIVLLSGLCLFGTTARAQGVIVNPDNPPTLKRDQGFVLLELAAEATAPKMHISRLRYRGTEPPEEAKRRTSSGRDQIIRFGDQPSGHVLLRLREGWYQITELDAPFFELPFKLDTSGDGLWLFGVFAGKTSYVGRLEIAKERQTEYVDVTLESRIATRYDDITREFDAVLGVAPLVHGRAIADPYFDLLVGERP